MKTTIVTLALVALALVAAACVPIRPTAADRLQFRVDVSHDIAGEFTLRPRVQNTGMSQSAPRPEANAVLELRDAHNILRARMEVYSLPAIEPGAIVEVAVWQARLDPGAYRLFWGAPGLGYTEAAFTVTEGVGGAQMSPMQATPHPDQDMPVLPTYGDAQPLVERAVADLAGQLQVEANAIRVAQVAPRDFPDASLGAPREGEMYAQVVTPGYVIELSHGDALYVYHGSGERVVPAPAGAGDSSQVGLAAAWTTVEVADIGLRFQAPDGWPSPAAWTWTAPGAAGRLLGFQWAQSAPPNLPEALFLPANAQSLGSEPVDLGWAAGRWHAVAVYRPVEQGQAGGQVEAYERHVIVLFERDGQRIGVDFYARAPTEEGLAGLLPLLEQMVESARR